MTSELALKILAMNENDFWMELLGFYQKNKRTINKGLRLGALGERMLLDFCMDANGSLSRRNLCQLALMFCEVTGMKLPDNIHARMILGESNEAVKEYIKYLGNIKPKFLWFNPNPNNFRMYTIGYAGSLRKLASK